MTLRVYISILKIAKIVEPERYLIFTSIQMLDIGVIDFGEKMVLCGSKMRVTEGR